MAKKKLEIGITGVDEGFSSLVKRAQDEAIKANKAIADSIQEPTGVAGQAAQEAQRVVSMGPSGEIEVRGIDEVIGLMRELIDVVRNTSEKEIRNETKQSEKEREEQEAGRLQNKRDEEQRAERGGGRSVFQDIELAGLLNNAFSAGRGIVTAGSADQFIGQGFQTAGSLVGSVANSLSGIPILGSAIETAIGAVGDAIQQSTERREGLFQAEAAFRALSGQGFSTRNFGGLRRGEPGGLVRDNRFTRLGVNPEELTRIAAEVSQAQGRVSGRGTLLQSVTAQRGFGIQSETINQILQQGRFADQGDILEELNKTLQNLQKEGIVTEEDRTLFGEVFRTQSQFVDFLSQSQEQVDRGGALSTLLSFNRLGGAFSARDPRSAGKIQSVVSGLQAPGSEFQQALQIDALRQFSPGGGILDILESQENIGQNPEAIKAIVDSVIRATGSQEAAILEARNLSGFQNLSIADLRRVFSGDFEAVGAEDFQTDQQKLVSLAERQVSLLEVQNTEIQNAFLESFKEGIETNAEIFGERMEMAVKQALDEIVPDIKAGISDALGFDIQGFIDQVTGFFDKVGAFVDSVQEFFSNDPLGRIGQSISDTIKELNPFSSDDDNVSGKRNLKRFPTSPTN